MGGAPVLTTVAGARWLARPAPVGRDSLPGEGLGDRARGLPVGASARVGALTITATPARHGPFGRPRIDKVVGFLIEGPGQPESDLRAAFAAAPLAARTRFLELGETLSV